MRLVDPDTQGELEPALRAVSSASSVRRSGVVELASGIDALYVSAHAAIPSALLERLEESRSTSMVAGGPIHIKFSGEQVRINPRALLKYRYWLSHAYGEIGVSPSGLMPPIRFQPKAEYLHAVSPQVAMEWFLDFMQREVGPMVMKASRLDLFVDVQGWALDGDDRHRFVSRAKEVTTHEDGDAFSARRQGELVKLLPQLRGYVSSVAAIEGGLPLPLALERVGRLIRDAEAKGSESFESRTSRKTARWELP